MSVDHSHCPDGCEKPQPFRTPDGREWCSRCLVKYGELREMVPCTPETCASDYAGVAK